MELTLGLSLGLGLPAALVLGIFLGFYIANKFFKKQMRENPPITESQIRAMYAQMGRKPTEQQIKMVMNSFKKQGKK